MSRIDSFEEKYLAALDKNSNLRKRLNRRISEGYKLKATKTHILDFMGTLTGDYVDVNTKGVSLHEFWCWVCEQQKSGDDDKGS